MIKSFFRQNATTGILYNSQAGAIIFVCSFAFKVSSLPSIIATYVQSSTLWLYLMMSTVDLISFVLIYYFFKDGYDQKLKTYFSYKIGVCLLMLFLTFKGVIFFAYSVMFLSVELFVDVSPIVVLSLMLMPVVYIGLKSIRAIARTAEIVLPLILIIIIANLVFLKAEIDFSRNLPMLAVDFDEFIKSSFHFGIWLGDPLPLLLITVKNKKYPYIGISAGCCWLLINISVMIGIALYGDSLFLVGNLFVRTAGFNQLSLEIGRMEWTSLFAVMVMGIMTESLIFWGINECSIRLISTKLPTQILYPILLFCLGIFLPSLQQIVDLAHIDIVGYISTAFALFIPIYFALLKYIDKRKILRFPDVYTRLPQNAKGGAV